ncbi:protein mab-21-like 2 [Stylophora pistillata]|uniref:protein mab-21-like 2 n=1 Tax=Stylophora pistillata TaxID=50429 RepID=UPI000C03CE95|nr:protein mab-21-like 2 [Stylophora pistillata]
MHPRFGSINPDDYDGGMPSLMSHVHNLRLESTLDDDSRLPCLRTKDSASAAPLAKLGRPLEREGETKQIQVAVETFVEDLLKCVGKLDSRFICKTIPSGSFYEGTKVGGPNEFDFMAEIEVLSFRGACTSIWDSAYPGRALVRPCPFLASTLFRDLLSDLSHLSSTSFHDAFFETLNKALRITDPLPQCWERIVKGCRKGPAVTLVLTWRGQKYRRLQVYVDITPAIKFFHWPQWTDLSATTNPCNKTSSTEDWKESYPKYLKEVVKLGFHLVPTFIFWRASFSVAEMHILKMFGPESNRLTCYRCAKFLRDHYRDGDRSVLTSYMLKTAFLFELEKFSDDKFWSNEQLFERLRGMLNFILIESKQEELGSYFVSSAPICNNEREYQILPKTVKDIMEHLNMFMLLGLEPWDHPL